MENNLSDDEEEVQPMHVYSGRIKSRIREVKPRYGVIKRFIAKVVSVERPKSKTNVFISYCWQWRREAVHELANFLKEQKDFRIWCDMRNQTGFPYEMMTKFIDEADIVISFFGKDYAETANCRREMEYAAFRNKEILPVRMDRDYRPDGWLVCIFKSQVRLDYCEDDSFEGTASKISHYIRTVKAQKYDKNDLSPLTEVTFKLNFNTAGVPRFSSSKYVQRPEDDQRIMAQMQRVAKRPRDGCLIVSGTSGVGKTTLMARMLLDEKNHAFFVNECNLNRVVWINCCDWRERFDEKQFVQKIIELCKEVEEFDRSAIFTDLQSLMHYFKKKCLQIAFVFDDLLSYPLIQFFFQKQHTADPPICFLIMDDPQMLTSKSTERHLVQKVEALQELDDLAMKHVMKTTFGLGTHLNEEQILKLAKSTFGLPFIASLISARISNCDGAKAASREYKNLHNLPPFKENGSTLKTVSQLLSTSLEKMDESLRPLYYGFLLFNPNEQVSLFDLGVLWGFDLNKENLYGLRGVCHGFEKQGLIRRVKRKILEDDDFIEKVLNGTEKKDNEQDDETIVLDDSTEDRFVVHELLFEAALERAKSEFGIERDDKKCLNKIRLKLISGLIADADVDKERDEAGLNVLLAMLKYQRISLFERIIEKLDPKSLARVCLRKSNQTIGMPFLQRLYHFSKWDMSPFTGNMFGSVDTGVQHSDLLNPSYRLIDKIFKKLIKAGGNKLLWRVVSEPQANNPYACLYVDILDDARDDHYMVDREPLLAKVHCWSPLHAETKWEAKLFDPLSKTDELVLAVFAGQLAEVKRLAGQCSDDNVQNQAAQVAARRGHLAILEFLIGKWPSTLRSIDDDRRPLLTIASRCGHYDTMKFVVDRYPASAKAVDVRGRTAIYWAAKNGHLNCVMYLHGKDADAAKIQDADGFSAVTAASADGRLEVVTFLVEHAPKEILLLRTNQLGGTALSVAAGCGELEIVKYLYPKYKPDEHAKALSVAAVKGQLEVVSHLLDLNLQLGQMIDPALQFTPIMLACANGHLNCVTFLYGKSEESVEIMGTKVTTVMAAATSGHLDVVQWLFFRDPDMARVKSSDGESAITLAEKTGHREIAQFLKDNEL